MLEFFETSTRNLLDAEAAAGVGHHVALSVVGHRAARRQRLHAGEGRPGEADQGLVDPVLDRPRHAVLRVRQGIADAATDGDTVRLPPVLIQPMAADDVAAAVAEVALGAPLNGTVEVAGPEQFRLDEFVRRGLRAEQRSARRWSPTRTRATSAPSWANARSSPPTAPSSARPASTTGSCRSASQDTTERK